MAGNTIDAKLRIAAEVAEAITALKSVRAELLETRRAAAGSAGGASTAAGGGTAKAAEAEMQQAIGQTKRRTDAERDAAAERKRIARDELEAKKATAREAKKLADVEELARRNKERADERVRRQQDADEKRAGRAKSYQAAALAPQLNDIFVGATTGQSPLTVALQQGPQIVQIYGGVRNTFAALASVLTPLRVALGGVAAGFGLLAVQAGLGAFESDRLNKSLALSGNIANTSLGQINGLALSISKETGTSIGFVRDVLAQLVNVSGQTDTTLGATGRAVAALAKLSGQSADEAVKGFENQAEGITAWSIKANRAYNFLTAPQVSYIRTLEQQGRVAEAIKFANEQLAGTLEQRSVGAIGLVERAWNAAGRAVGFFLDQLKAVGRDSTAEERLEAIRKKLAEIDGRRAIRAAGGLFAGRRAATDDAERERLLAEQSAVNRELLRKTEDSAALKAEQARINTEAKEFAQVLASQRSAEAQRSLAQREAQLDAERALVEKNYAQQRTSAADQAQQLNAIDQRRALAQQALIERQIEIENQRTPSLENKAEVETQRVQIIQLQAQLIGARARVATAVAQGRTLIDAEIARLDQELARRQSENLEAEAQRVVDPQERARKEAEASTAQARKELADLERDLRSRQQSLAGLDGSEGLQARNQAVLDEARKSLAELTRRAQLDSVLRQTAELQQALAVTEREAEQLVKLGALSTEEAEARKIQARAEALPQLRALLALQVGLAQTPGEQTALRALLLDLDLLGDKTTDLQRTLRTSVQSGFEQFFESLVTGSKSGLGAIKDFVSGIARSMLDLISRKLGEQLLKSLFDGANSGGGSGGGALSALVQAVFASVKHTGGLISGSGGVSRAISPLAFAGAQVLHSGGLVAAQQMGLRKNEVPVIAEVGEEMLTEDNPRHIKNYRGQGVSMSTSITVNGASGTEQTQRSELQQLEQMMLATVERWAATQRRQGGMLAGGARG